VAELAARQHGIVARRQLLALGLSRRAIQVRVDGGRLHPLHAGVYAVGHSNVSNRGRYMAAALAGGAGTVISHRSAAVLWGIAAEIEGPIHITVGRGCHPRPGIVMHRSRRLGGDQGARVDSIPVTAAPRTLLDLAGVVTPTQLRRAFDEADRLELLDPAALAELCEAPSTRALRGSGRLRSLLAGRVGPLPETRSALEHRFLRVCQRAGLPRPAVNVPVAGLEVDCLWPSERVVVELDGFAYHRGRGAFERDRRRDGTLLAAEYRVLRITNHRLVNEPSAVVSEIRSLLGDPAR
jgi:hypothetical protein